MLILKGTSVFSGVSIGTLRFLKKESATAARRAVEDTEKEVARFEKARALSMAQSDDLYHEAKNKAGEESAAIFEIHKMMLDDPDFYESVIRLIREQNVCAEYAVDHTANNMSQAFSSMDDAYMKERAADVMDIAARIQNALHPEGPSSFDWPAPCIVAARDLTPSETVQFDRNMVLGFATSEGSVNSHAAILAKSIGIPAVIGIGDELHTGLDGAPAILDGFTGTLYIEPDAETSAALNSKQKEAAKALALLETLKGQPNITRDGRKIGVFANAAELSDCDEALKQDAEGIGLFRSEFIYLSGNDYPTEQQQFAVYKRAVQTMNGKKTIIRTLDIGADKQADYFCLPKEENPAMGMRAIRICLTKPELFKTQLRALYRASAYGNIAIMFPMITSVRETQEILQILEEVKAELREEKIDFNAHVEIGAMVETPAAVMISDELAKMFDFLCIGTNDLTQYTLAIDRQNHQLDRFCDTHHPAILKMIEMTVHAAHSAGIWCGICGELAGDFALTEYFLRIGVDELSVSARKILPLREKIRSLDLSETAAKP